MRDKNFLCIVHFLQSRIIATFTCYLMHIRKKGKKVYIIDKLSHYDRTIVMSQISAFVNEFVTAFVNPYSVPSTYQSTSLADRKKHPTRYFISRLECRDCLTVVVDIYIVRTMPALQQREIPSFSLLPPGLGYVLS